MPDNDDLINVQTYRNLVLRYEAMHAEINGLFQTHPGGTETMTDQEVAQYRDMARQRDELLNEMRLLEQQLLDDENLQPE